MRALALLLSLVITLTAAPVAQQAPREALRPSQVEPGITSYELSEPAYFGAGSPISGRLLEIRPSAARLDIEYGKSGKQGRETVPVMAERRDAIAAINAGFFGTNGDPAGIFKINGLLVSDTARPRGAVGFATAAGPPLLFGRVTAGASIKAGRARAAVTGIDTVRGARGVILYTPRYGADTRATGDGTEWTLQGSPLRVTRISTSEASSIPPDGFVLSAAGAVPPALARLKLGDRVEIDTTYTSQAGAPRAAWQRADDIVGGAGLLLWRGRDAQDWAAERLDAKAFVDARHPRTLIGVDREGDVWLVVIDGRQPEHSVGMSLPELTALARRLGLVDALNLDGGGSSTMVVKGKIVNRPSDPTGPRPVSDAIVVLRR